MLRIINLIKENGCQYMKESKRHTIINDICTYILYAHNIYTYISMIKSEEYNMATKALYARKGVDKKYNQ